MKAEITRVATDENHYYDVRVAGEFMGVFKKRGESFGYSASAGGKTYEQISAVKEVWFCLLADLAMGDDELIKEHHKEINGGYTGDLSYACSVCAKWTSGPQGSDKTKILCGKCTMEKKKTGGSDGV